ncbi:SDR family NAD(P)-dependent oxidoreductase [Aquihabitans sp. McL0605]|uniref:SDR family NAD(P)-dependent oxidoreductase n=1 Tax=Aquihabitans sp. McL0605 TaxID=3415671 RepID=UPI003CF81F49
MDDFTGTTALVTGGASGIGRGLATSLLEDGAAHVVLADIEAEALAEAVAALTGLGLGEVSGIRCDVTDPESVELTASLAWERTGGLRVVCLNAGVFAGGYAWETTLDDWDWVLGVNLRGMINGVRSFVPRLIDAGEPSHLIGTASIAGIVAAPASAVYCTSKFAAVGLMESVQHDLGLAGATHVATSVICPGMVATNIDHGERNRPAALGDATDTEASHLSGDSIEKILAESGLDPLVGARHALGQAKAGRFYVTTHEGDMWDRLVGNENDDRLAGRPPRFQMYE